MYIYIYINLPSLYLSISLSLSLSIYLSICLSIYLSFFISFYLSIYLPLNISTLSIYLSINQSIYLIIYLSTVSIYSIDLSFYLSFYLSSNLSIDLSIDLSIYLSIDLSIDLSIHPSSSIYVCIYIYIYTCRMLQGCNEATLTCGGTTLWADKNNGSWVLYSKCWKSHTVSNNCSSRHPMYVPYSLDIGNLFCQICNTLQIDGPYLLTLIKPHTIPMALTQTSARLNSNHLLREKNKKHTFRSSDSWAIATWPQVKEGYHVISYISYTSFPSYGHLHIKWLMDIQRMSRVPPDWEPRFPKAWNFHSKPRMSHLRCWDLVEHAICDGTHFLGYLVGGFNHLEKY